MADKESTVYIIDVGLSMGADHDLVMQYVWDKITSAVATGRKTATVGVIGLRTDDTDNDMGGEEGFEHITTYQPISQIQMPELRTLRTKIEPSKTLDGDAISALVVAIQMISTYCRKLKYRRRIVLITDARGPMDLDDLHEIIKKIDEDSVELVIIGVDFKNAPVESGKPDRSRVKAENEATLKKLVQTCKGIYGDLKEVIADMGIPATNYETVLSIDVERYPRTKVAPAPTASGFVVRSELGQDETTVASSSKITDQGAAVINDNGDIDSGLAQVKSNRTYQVLDESVAGGQRDVDRVDLARGYEYGRTVVHVSTSDENITRLETKPGMELIGFVSKEKYQRYMHMSASCVIVGQKSNEKASMALSSFIHALYELDSFAVARLVTKEDSGPVLLLLAPSIEPDFECLVDVELPFAEDVRSYRFPPLDRVVTVSGKVLTEHRHLPNDRLKQAMSDLVDEMDLSEYGVDDEGKPTEYMTMDETFSPVLHRIDQAVRWRAMNPDAKIPPPYTILTKYSTTPAKLVRPETINALQSAADIKEVPPKLKGRRRGETAKPLSGLDIEGILRSEKRGSRISANNAIPEFKQMLEVAADDNDIADAAAQLSRIIRSRLQGGPSSLQQAVEETSVMREELILLEEPQIFNEFFNELKTDLLANEDYRAVWNELQRVGLAPVD